MSLAYSETSKTGLVGSRPNYVTLNCPVYARVSNSRYIKVSFHYNVVKCVYSEKADVCFSDTDSLCYFIETDDFFGDLKSDRFPNCFDFSDLPKHTLFIALRTKTN